MANTPTPAVTVPSNTAGSNKSAPAPKVAVPANITKWLGLALVAGALVIGIIMIASIALNSSREQRVSTQQSQQQSVPAGQQLVWLENGYSVRMKAREGDIVKWYGNGFTSHCVYVSGRTETHDENEVCGSGELDYQYVHVTTGNPNSITFEFVRRQY